MTSLPSLGDGEVFSPTSATQYNPNQKMERSHNYKFTIQRDIGFSTVLTACLRRELSIVTRLKHSSINNIPYQAYANSANVFNGAEINANFLRTSFPGMGR